MLWIRQLWIASSEQPAASPEPRMSTTSASAGSVISFTQSCTLRWTRICRPAKAIRLPKRYGMRLCIHNHGLPRSLSMLIRVGTVVWIHTRLLRITHTDQRVQVNALRNLPSRQMEIAFLLLMIRHHQGGAMIAQEMP